MIFSDLANIINTMKDNFHEEKAEDPQLNLKIINRSLKSVSFNAQAFSGYKKRTNLTWTLEKYIAYTKEDLLSFFREFDNPFLSSQRWSLRIKELLTMLSREYDELEKLSNLKDS